MTYQIAQAEESKHLACTRSHLTGKTFNRFAAIHQTPIDLVNKVKMPRLLGQKAGSCEIDMLLADVCKQNVTRFPMRSPASPQTSPEESWSPCLRNKDLRNERMGPCVQKYLKEVASVPTEHRMRILRLIENITLGTAQVRPKPSGS